MGERSVIIDPVQAQGFEVLRDGTLIFYAHNNGIGGVKKNIAAYKEWLRVYETDE